MGARAWGAGLQRLKRGDPKKPDDFLGLKSQGEVVP